MNRFRLSGRAVFRQTPQSEKHFRQYRTKSVWRLCTPSACKFPVIFHKNAREYIKYSLRFLFHLTKNLTTHLSHNLCVVLPWIESCESPIGNSRAFFVCIWGENIYTAQFGEIYVYNSLLDTAEEVWYNNKAVARERKTRKLVDSRNRETDREIDRGAVEVVQEKFTWQNVWSVVEWMGWLFWTGCRGKGKENMEWTSVHKMFTWQNRQNVIK